MHLIQLAEADPADSFPERLRKALISTVALRRWSGLVVHLRLVIYGILREDLRPDLLNAAQELMTNSIDHGLYQRSFGRISVALHGNVARTLLRVTDNGWGVGPSPIRGGGSGFLGSLGTFSLKDVQEAGRTTGAAARLLIPGDTHRRQP